MDKGQLCVRQIKWAELKMQPTNQRMLGRDQCWTCASMWLANKRIYIECQVNGQMKPVEYSKPVIPSFVFAAQNLECY